MSFHTRDYLSRLTKEQWVQLITTTSEFGYHPETGDEFLVPIKDRYSGCVVTGTPGNGKSGMLLSLIQQDIMNNLPVIVLDPHGDLVDNIIAKMPDPFIEKTYLLDMQDEKYPFGLNLFAGANNSSSVKQAQAVDRVMHCFEVLWPDVLNQLWLPRFLRAAIITLLANKGSTLVDMERFLTDTNYRWQCLDNVQDQSVKQFWQAFEEMPANERRQQIAPLITRLEALFMARSIVRNIVGQRETTINLRQAIENKEIILIKLPLKILPQDARLIGILIVALIHATVFSFADLPESERPGFSLYVDEFQNFATTDFAEMFTEGRKFGCRLTVAHQYRSQLPAFLKAATMTARTKVCFQQTPEDSKEWAPVFIQGESSVKPEDIEPKPVEWLLRYGSDSPEIQTFIDWYLLPLQSHKKGGQVEIRKPGLLRQNFDIQPKEPDPTPYLNRLLYEVMKTGNAEMQIPSEVVYGLANSGIGFYAAWNRALKGRYLRPGLFFPRHLVLKTPQGWKWSRPPESSKEQLYHCLFHIRETMKYLAANPIGKKTEVSQSEISRMLMLLPRRAAFIRSGDDVGVIYTEDSLLSVGEDEYYGRIGIIKAQTVQKYCRKVNDQQSLDVPATKPQFKRWQEVI